MIEGLVWDRGNTDELAGHTIRPHEVTDMVFWGSWIRVRNRRYPGQILVIGYTTWGRWLTVAMEPTRTPGAWRPITGWPSTGREMDRYARQKGLRRALGT